MSGFFPPGFPICVLRHAFNSQADILNSVLALLPTLCRTLRSICGERFESFQSLLGTYIQPCMCEFDSQIFRKDTAFQKCSINSTVLLVFVFTTHSLCFSQLVSLLLLIAAVLNWWLLVVWQTPWGWAFHLRKL